MLNGGQRGWAPVAKRREKRIEREFSWADQVAGLREFAWGLWRESRRRWLAREKRVGLWRELFSESRERVVLGDCSEE